MLLHVQDLRDLLQRDGCLPHRLVDAAQPLHGPEQAADIAEEGDDRADRHRALQHEPAADADGGKARDRDDDVARRAVAGVRRHAPDHDLVRLRDVVEEAALLGVLHGEAAHDEDAGENLVEAGIDARPAVEQRALARGLLGRGHQRHQGRHRREAQHDEGEAPVEVDHDHGGHDEEDKRGNDVEQDLRHRAHQPLDAAVEPRQHRAHAFAALDAERHAVELADRRLEQRVLQADARPPGEPVGRRVRAFAADGEGGERAEAGQERVERRIAREPVEDELEHERLDRADRGDEQGQREDRRDREAVREGEAHGLVQPAEPGARPCFRQRGRYGRR